MGELPRVRPLLWDNHLLWVVKPAGMPSVPDASGDPSLLEAAREWVRRRFGKPGAVYLGVVQRLDRPVSGVLLFARTSKAARRLTAAFREGHADKVYLGLVEGALPAEHGAVEVFLKKDRTRNTARIVAPGLPGAKRALTRWRVLAEMDGRTLLELRPRTGRSHQLRATLAHLGAPLVGDLRYGARAPLPDRSIALHARELAVPHPTRGEVVCARAPLPDLALWEPFRHVDRGVGKADDG